MFENTVSWICPICSKVRTELDYDKIWNVAKLKNDSAHESQTNRYSLINTFIKAIILHDMKVNQLLF